MDGMSNAWSAEVPPPGAVELHPGGRRSMVRGVPSLISGVSKPLELPGVSSGLGGGYCNELVLGLLPGPWDVGVPSGLGGGYCNELVLGLLGVGGYGNELVLELGLVGVFECATREYCAPPCRFSSRKSRGQGSPLPPGVKGKPEAA